MILQVGDLVRLICGCQVEITDPDYEPGVAAFGKVKDRCNTYSRDADAPDTLVVYFSRIDEVI